MTADGPGAGTGVRVPPAGLPAAASWHARVDCGGEVGAGFLVSEREVLTCAHVVRERHTGADVTVTFPHARPLGGVAARVVAHGGWGGGDLDTGDVAVLELERTVSLAPVEFAAPGDGYGDPPRRLLVYGFPARFDEGVLAEYRATATQRISDEWVQLEPWTGHGRPIAPGFSGAAAVLADTGRAVGMVTSADRGGPARGGRMLPVAVLARYWARLTELIPTRGFGRADKETLRRLVTAAGADGPECVPDRLYAESVDPVGGPPLPPGGFPALWDVVWYLLSEVDDPAAPARFADRLADFVSDPEVRYGLRRWAARGGPPPPAAPPAATAAVPPPAPTAYPPPVPPAVPPPPAVPAPSGVVYRERPSGGVPGERPAPAWSPIVVELERSGSGRGQYLAQVSAYRDGHRRVVGARTLAKRALPRYVAERVDEAFHELPHGAPVLIAFVVPRALLNEPVDRWPRGAGDPSPLGCLYPLVVLDRERRRQGGRRHELLRKWERLDARERAELYRVECGSAEDQGRLTVRLWEDGQMMGFTAPPTSPRMKRLFAAGLNGSVPVLLWPRTGCDGRHGDGEPCAGREFLDELTAYVARLPPAELPSHIRALRSVVYLSDDPGSHWARDLTLLWEDPRCFPEPPGHAASPVG
ncbi:trypsin-like peptidase domain-containing protein [Streptomyces uncialis]|uniref:VMAP-C domain-containing protein n=1 Tax=Streptomyces uncialis TaxID=1048205 RepID=UPI00224EC24D|nr:trypsin-like peptidase domain-containing protein [Streptomyces uncialis]MCX4663667.1 serine protease [Streptomyces uncialis]